MRVRIRLVVWLLYGCRDCILWLKGAAHSQCTSLLYLRVCDSVRASTCNVEAVEEAGNEEETEAEYLNEGREHEQRHALDTPVC